jgi:hypothetical protein
MVVGYTHLKTTCVLPLLPLFISLKCNVNVTVEGSCNMSRFLIFTTYFTNFLHVDATSLLLLMPTHHRHVVQQLLEVHLLSL